MSKKHKALSPQTMQLVAERFKVMSDPMRLQILSTLQNGELSVTGIVDQTGASQPNVSKHLKMLQQAGIVSRRPEGNQVFYGIADESIFVLCNLVCNSIESQVRKKADVFTMG